MLAEYKDVVPVIANPLGWGPNEVKIKHDSAPGFDHQMQTMMEAARQRTIEIRTKPPFADTNGYKAAARRLATSGNMLSVDTYLTEYFVLWGLPGVAPKLHQQALDDLSKHQATEIPMGISTHNIVLLTPDGSKNPDNAAVAMIVNDPRHGFAPGRLSISYEGQLDPTKDLDPDRRTPSTFETVLRTVREEFGIGENQSPLKITPADIRLLAVCAEKGSAYTSWCHIVWVKGHPDDLKNSYQLAHRRRDANALLTVPLRQLDNFAKGLTIDATHQSYLIAGTLPAGTELQAHPTVLWRADALKDHLTANH